MADNKETAGELSVEELKAMLQAEREQKESALALVAKQNARIEEVEAEKGSHYPTVKVEKETYQIVITKMIYKGAEITAAGVKKDKALAAELVEAGSGMLVKIEKEAK